MSGFALRLVSEACNDLDQNSINCSFKYGCGCGYTQYSTNINLLMSMQQFENTSYHYLLIEHENDLMSGIPTTETDWIRLVSPQMDLKAPSCLRMYYFSRYVNISIHRYNSQRNMDKLFSFTNNGALGDWHWLEVNLSPGYYGILVDFQFTKRSAQRNAGVTNITVTEGRCLRSNGRDVIIILNGFYYYISLRHLCIQNIYRFI